MRISSIMICFVFFCCNAMAQEKVYDKEFALVAQAYSDTKNFSSDVTVYSYKEKGQEKADLLGKGMIRKADKNYYSAFRGEVMIANNHCAVIIDSSNKQVTYFGEAKGHTQDPFSMSKIDSLLKKQDSVVYMGAQAGVEHYIFYNKKSILTRVDMYTDVKDHFIKRLTYYYTPSDKMHKYGMYKMDIYYNNIKTEKVNDSYFSEKSVLAYKGGKPYLQSAYHDFKLTVADKYQPPTQ